MHGFGFVLHCIDLDWKLNPICTTMTSVQKLQMCGRVGRGDV